MDVRWILVAVAVVAVAGGAFVAVELAGDGSTTTTVAPTTAPTVEVPTSGAPTSTTTAPPQVALGEIEVEAVPVATVPFATAMAVRPGDPSFYVTQRLGTISRVSDGEVETVLDLSQEVGSTERTFDEQGLLGLAFDPEGRFLYVDYTDTNGDTRVDEFAMTPTGPDPGSRREVLRVAQPARNHNGGNLAFGPDGQLYVSLGDGGGGGDPDGHGQNPATLLGSILRIHPRPADGAAYAVPGNNPFVGAEGSRPEIWAYGLRNPWRFSFDRETGDLWIGDVGQSSFEEINFEPAGSGGGRNYGWNRLEGTRRFAGDPPNDHVLPIHEYPLGGNACSVTGGYVYRGSAIPELRGVYLFADVCIGQLMGLRHDGGELVEVDSLGVSVNLPVSFGEDAEGEVYVLSLEGGIFRLAPGG